jgi:excisionase family DNA binding protein
MTVPALLTEREVAARLRVGKTTVQRWRAQGLIPFVRIGDCVRYRVVDVENFEADHYHDAAVVSLPRRRNA